MIPLRDLVWTNFQLVSKQYYTKYNYTYSDFTVKKKKYTEIIKINKYISEAIIS